MSASQELVLHTVRYSVVDYDGSWVARFESLELETTARSLAGLRRAAREVLAIKLSLESIEASGITLREIVEHEI